MDQPKIPKKRGRKPKNINNDCKKEEVKIPKKRGRKPKGGKIITENVNETTLNVSKPNIILHLKCNSQNKNCGTNNHSNNIKPFNINNINKNKDLNYDYFNDDKILDNNTKSINNNDSDIKLNDKEENNLTKININEKLKILQNQLHNNNISCKKSACFWCTYDFDNPPVYIPINKVDNNYNVYGCFCSPECSVSYLFKENIDDSTRFERYSLINNIYTKIYDYKKNIKPAPNPYYTLDKYYGNLTIAQYRKLLQYDRILFIIDKPLTKITPELHDENDDILSSSINNNILENESSYFKKSSYI